MLFFILVDVFFFKDFKLLGLFLFLSFFGWNDIKYITVNFLFRCIVLLGCTKELFIIFVIDGMTFGCGLA